MLSQVATEMGDSL